MSETVTASFKGFDTDGTDDHTVDTELEQQILDQEPLYEPFDPRTEGGLSIGADGIIHETYHPKWSRDGQDNVTQRTRPLPRLHYDQASGTVEWETEPFDPSRPSLGGEFEEGVMTPQSEHHIITTNGAQIHYPDGRTEERPKWIDPEAFKQMIEYKSDISYGTTELRHNVIAAAYNTERWLHQNGLISPNLSMHPDDLKPDDVTEDGYVLNTSHNMVSMREFGVQSNQLHVQMLDPDAAQHAMNRYQQVQAVFGLLTSAAPVRDGRFDQTMARHYDTTGDADGKPHEYFEQPRIPAEDGLQAMVTPSEAITLLPHGDAEPYDWRENGRYLGSQSAGAIANAAPVDLNKYLSQADGNLRDGSIISSVRELGWHTDRLRIDKGTIEICNLGTAGGNLHKTSAVQEVVAKYLVAEQQRYASMTERERADEQADYQADVETGHWNNMRAGMYGRLALFEGRDGYKTPAEMLHNIIDIADQYGGEPVSQRSRDELLATLQGMPDTTAYATPEDTFRAFMQPGSTMTATDALRLGHQLEPDTPSNTLLARYARIKQEHVFGMHDEVLSEAERRAGNLATVAMQSVQVGEASNENV